MASSNRRKKQNRAKAAAKRAAGDAGEERRLIDQALAAAEAGDPDVRLEVIDFISTSGHAEATAGLPRWTVWLGGIVPVDGIWRSDLAG